jgi:dipeptide/tripeptide permease
MFFSLLIWVSFANWMAGSPMCSSLTSVSLPLFPCSIDLGNGGVLVVLSAAVPLTPTGLHVSFDWTNAVSSQLIIVFVGLYMVGVGYGAPNPCITSFDVDQFDHTDEEEKHRKSSFFNWRYFILNAASLFSEIIQLALFYSKTMTAGSGVLP